MVRSHLPAAMQGLVVVPLFAGFDVRRGVGRLFQYDVTGGRYEESDFAATGSGSLHAGTVVKLGFRDGLDRGEHRRPGHLALFQAADEDSATGGPDLVRGIFPVVATITADGFERVPDDEVATRFRALLDRLSAPGSTTVTGTTADHPGRIGAMSMPFYVAPEQLMKDQADYAAQGHRPRPRPWPPWSTPTAS